MISSMMNVWFRDEVMKKICQNLVESMPKRIREMIKNKGGHIDYFMNHQYGLDTGNSFAVEKNSRNILSVQINLHGTVISTLRSARSL